MSDELLRPSDVAAEYGIDESTLSTWRWRTRRGEPSGPASFLLTPGVVVYRRSVVEAWVEQRERAAS